MGRYAAWTPTRAERALYHLRVTLRWPLRPLRRVWRRIERTPVLVALWERRAGRDYTGWTVRSLCGDSTTAVGEVGTVTGYELRRRRRHYIVAFERGDLLTGLPAPQLVELIPPTHR